MGDPSCNDMCLTYVDGNLKMRKCEPGNPDQTFAWGNNGLQQETSRCLSNQKKNAIMSPLPSSGDSPCAHNVNRLTVNTSSYWELLTAATKRNKCMGKCDKGEITMENPPCDNYKYWTLNLATPASMQERRILGDASCADFAGSWLPVEGTMGLVDLVLSGDQLKGTATFHTGDGEPTYQFEFELHPGDSCGIKLYWSPGGNYMEGLLTDRDTITWTDGDGVWRRAAPPQGTCTVERYDTSAMVLQEGLKERCAFAGAWLPTMSDPSHFVSIVPNLDIPGTATAYYNLPFPYHESMDLDDVDCSLVLHEGGEGLTQHGRLSPDGNQILWANEIWGVWTRAEGNQACNVCRGRGFFLDGLYRCYNPQDGTCLWAPDAESCKNATGPNAFWCAPHLADSGNLI